jgi:DNA invertase Pin-like site-specific DNA recombinase
MDKNSYYETVKNTAIEKVLNKYSSDSDSSRPALKKLLEDLLDWFMLYIS